MARKRRLLLVLMAIEATDVVFAVDSILRSSLSRAIRSSSIRPTSSQFWGSESVLPAGRCHQQPALSQDRLGTGAVPSWE